MKYSISKGIWKGVKVLILVGIPFFLTTFPDIANLTIGGLLIIFVNYVKVKKGWKFL